MTSDYFFADFALVGLATVSTDFGGFARYVMTIGFSSVPGFCQDVHLQFGYILHP